MKTGKRELLKGQSNKIIGILFFICFLLMVAHPTIDFYMYLCIILFGGWVLKK